MYDPPHIISDLPTMAFSPSSTTESNASTSPPFTRDSSPSPSISPTPALSACPPLGRSFSANSSSTYSTSSGSTFSHPSVTSRSSSASAALRQRGYVRPQGVTFAPSAGNRDSVLSLGSIAHLQYYFARTGLLDGKGGQLAKEKKNKNDILNPTNVLPKIRDSPDLERFTESSIDSISPEEADHDFEEPLMLPPTVSTYSHRVQYIPPPPDSATLREDLRIALRDAKKALQEAQDQAKEALDRRKTEQSSDVVGEEAGNKTSSSFSESSGWYEIQGVHILDVVTLAIRAAKIYYTAHDDPHRLYSIKSERQIRQELFSVLDLLKRMASRNFSGGMKDEELKTIKDWVEGIDAFLAKEEAMEEQEKQTRDSWEWLEGSWEGREREREWRFLCSFLPDGTLPEWTLIDPSSPASTPLLEALRSGLTLIHLHNALLKKSKRQFGDIKAFHTDTAKPYRCAENLRYWIKAAEIRWETKLKVNVSGVVNGKTEVWPDFDAAILQWSRAVREELTKEWRQAPERIEPAIYPEFQDPSSIERDESRSS